MTFTLSTTISSFSSDYDLEDSISDQIWEDLSEMGHDVLQAAEPCWIEESLRNFNIVCCDTADLARDELAEYIIDHVEITHVIDGDNVIVTLEF